MFILKSQVSMKSVGYKKNSSNKRKSFIMGKSLSSIFYDGGLYYRETSPLICKSVDWFLYDRVLRHERVKSNLYRSCSYFLLNPLQKRKCYSQKKWYLNRFYENPKHIHEKNGFFFDNFFTLRPKLVKSLVIVIYFFEIEMRDAVIIINYCCIVTLQGKMVAK